MKKYIIILLLLSLFFVFQIANAIDNIPVNTTLPHPDDEVILSAEENNVKIDITDIDIVTIPEYVLTGNNSDNEEFVYLQVNMCFTSLDDGDWHVIPGKSLIDENEIMARSFEYGGYVVATNDTPGKICGQLRYDLTNLSIDINSSLSIVIKELYAAPREGSPCKDILYRYETNSAVQIMNIELSCTDNYESDVIRSDKDYILAVKSYDESKGSREDMLREIEKILSPHIEGNWTFHIENISEFAYRMTGNMTQRSNCPSRETVVT